MADKENIEPNLAPKRRCLSLSLKKKDKDRFATISKDTLDEMSKYKMPKNSAINSKWAVKNLTDWVEDYNRRNPDKPCPSDILSPFCGKDILNDWLCIYVNETRNQRGEPYSPKTLYALPCGILREMRVCNSSYPNFLEKKDPDFKAFTTTRDNLFKSLRSCGIGSSSSHTEGISREDEMQLWSSGVLNIDSPKGLLRAVFFYCGKCFCLRGGQEHRDLTLSQLERLHDPDRYIYRENSSKNKQGGLRQMRLEHKVVTIVANPAVKEKCPVFLLDQYISKLPKEAKDKDIFYCRPLQNIPKNSTEPWYTASPIGRNMLQTMVHQMCEEAGIDGRKTNHSLRVSGTTSLFAAGVPERVIQGRSGHSSLEALRKYERVTGEQEKAVSKILTGETDHYELLPASVAVSSSDSLGPMSKSPIVSAPPVVSTCSSVMYKDCVVNMYSAPPIPLSFPPYHSYPFQTPYGPVSMPYEASTSYSFPYQPPYSIPQPTNFPDSKKTDH